MRKLYLGVTWLMVLISGPLRAQQKPILTTYTYNLMTVNPAYTGCQGDVDISVAGGTSTPHIEGAPQFANLTIHTSLASNKVGLGGMVLQDKVGVTNTVGVYGTYSYKLIERNHNSYTNWKYYPDVFSFGLQAGITSIREDLRSLNIDNDPNFRSNVNETIPSFGFGFFYSKRYFYTGISVSDLLHSLFSENKNLNFQSHYYFQLGYIKELSPHIAVKPATLLKYTDGAPLQFDANLIFEYNDILELGVGYRSTASANLLVGLHISKKVRVVYHYDVALESDQEALRNTNGILLSYRPRRR